MPRKTRNSNKDDHSSPPTPKPKSHKSKSVLTKVADLITRVKDEMSSPASSPLTDIISQMGGQLAPTGPDLDDATVQRLLQTSVDQDLLRIGALQCPTEACKETVAIAEQSDSGGEEVQGAAGRIVNENLPRPPRLPNPHPRNNRGYYNLTFDMDFPTEDFQSSES